MRELRLLTEKRYILALTLLLRISYGYAQQGIRGDSWQLIWQMNLNPFHAPHYILLNLALGGDNGGRISDDTFPMRYEIDHVRVRQKLTRTHR